MDRDRKSPDKDKVSCDRGDPDVDGQSWAGSPGSSPAPDLKTTVSLEGEESYLCDDKLKKQLDTLVIRENSVDARLQEVETRLASAETKLRSCNDILALIGLLKDRIRLVDEDEILPSNAESSSSFSGHQAEGYASRSPLRSPNSPMRSAKSPIRSPKSPRSH
ncbi:uncharacterized protein LOC119719280 [Patiria miniata]|uniref:Uncharacterized protein n=1 Tax=Patiria miniata TaxID=46514 RepID=A0A913Z0S0_PATMI|nr:uncharacterized protein LOC119719280 [Patiria miniata]